MGGECDGLDPEGIICPRMDFCVVCFLVCSCLETGERDGSDAPHLIAFRTSVICVPPRTSLSPSLLVEFDRSLFYS